MHNSHKKKTYSVKLFQDKVKELIAAHKTVREAQEQLKSEVAPKEEEAKPLTSDQIEYYNIRKRIEEITKRRNFLKLENYKRRQNLNQFEEFIEDKGDMAGDTKIIDVSKKNNSGKNESLLIRK